MYHHVRETIKLTYGDGTKKRTLDSQTKKDPHYRHGGPSQKQTYGNDPLINVLGQNQGHHRVQVLNLCRAIKDQTVCSFKQ